MFCEYKIYVSESNYLEKSQNEERSDHDRVSPTLVFANQHTRVHGPWDNVIIKGTGPKLILRKNFKFNLSSFQNGPAQFKETKHKSVTYKGKSFWSNNNI